MKEAGVAILIFKEIDFEPILIKRDREGHIILIRGKIYQNELSVQNPEIPTTRTPTFLKKH